MLGPMVRSWSSALCLALCLAATGCDFLGTEYEREEQAGQLASCRDGASDAEVQDNILITERYAGSMAADLTLGWSTFLFVMDFTILWGQTVAGLPSNEPVGWSYEDGTYRYGSGHAAIEMRVFLSEELSSLGPAGTQVTEDILDIESFLVGATIEADGETTTITFEEPGPLAELLGLGEELTSPLTLGPEDRERVLASLGTLSLETDLVAYGVISGPILFDYHLRSGPATIAHISQEGLMPLELVEVNAVREDLGQRLATDRWEVETRGTRISGYTTFTVSGGYFPYQGRIDFTDLALVVIADRELDCL